MSKAKATPKSSDAELIHLCQQIDLLSLDTTTFKVNAYVDVVNEEHIRGVLLSIAEHQVEIMIASQMVGLTANETAVC